MSSTSTVTLEAIQTADGQGWLRSTTTTLLRHLCYCELQSAETKTRAENDHIDHGGAGSPSKGRHN